MQVGRITQLEGGAKELETAGNVMSAGFVVAHLRDVLEQIVKAVDEADGDKRIRELAANAVAQVSMTEARLETPLGADTIRELFTSEDFKEEVLDALRGSIPEEPHLHPISLLESFIRDLERDDVIALVASSDPDAHRELLADVKLMWGQLAAISAAEPLPKRE